MGEHLRPPHELLAADADPPCFAQASRASKSGTTRTAAKLRLLPIITASATNLFVFRRFSMGWGAMFLPPAVTMMSFLRSVMLGSRRRPATPMSPVWNQPSVSIASAVASGLLK